jgi:hypothetical protein
MPNTGAKPSSDPRQRFVRKRLPFISVIKDSVIVSVSSISELTFQGLQIMASTYITFEIWITIGAMYGSPRVVPWQLPNWRDPCDIESYSDNGLAW